MSYTVFPEVFFIAFSALGFAFLYCRAELNSAEKKFSNTCGILMVVYASLLLYLTTVNGRDKFIESLTLTPFASYIFVLTEYNSFEVLAQIFQNILVFIPAGILIPQAFYLKNKKHSGVITVLLGLFLSFFIELCQYVYSIGYAEVDDLINNSLGCLIGYGIFRFCSKIELNGNGIQIKREAFQYLLPLALSVCVMFCIVIYREFVLYYRWVL